MLNRRNASDFPAQLSHCSILETYLREAFGNESNRDPMTRTDLSLFLYQQILNYYHVRQTRGSDSIRYCLSYTGVQLSNT